MRCGPGSELAPSSYRGRIIRVVEAQHRISTNRLAGNTADQALLEALADEVKPLLPEAAGQLPWLLASPFRYGLGRPSRFRAADVLPGIFYAAETIDTAVTETAYWRLLAFSRSPGFLRPRTPTPMSAFFGSDRNAPRDRPYHRALCYAYRALDAPNRLSPDPAIGGRGPPRQHCRDPRAVRPPCRRRHAGGT